MHYFVPRVASSEGLLKMLRLRLELALDVAVEAIELICAHTEQGKSYVEEMDRRIKLVIHKLDIQAIRVREHGQVLDNHFELQQTALVVLRGQPMSMEHSVRSMIVRRRRAGVELNIKVVMIGLFVVLGFILLGLFAYFL